MARASGENGKNLGHKWSQRTPKKSKECARITCSKKLPKERIWRGLCNFPNFSTRGQPESDKEQREQHGRRQRDKDHRGKDEERKRQRHHYEFDKFMRRKDETKWGKGYCQERAKKEGHHHGYSYCPDSGDKLGKEDRDELSNRKERLRNKVSEKVSMRSRCGKWGEDGLGMKTKCSCLCQTARGGCPRSPPCHLQLNLTSLSGSLLMS